MKRLLLRVIIGSLIGLAIGAGFLAIFDLFVQPVMYNRYYLDVMRKCNDPSKKVIVRSWFSRGYNFTEIYDWVHGNLNFTSPDQRHTDPINIKESGKGLCQEFSILYTAACLAHGYECRLVVATETSGLGFSGCHAWAEVMLSGHWVHVDPSDRRWGEPLMYKQWSWGEHIGSKVKIFAYGDSEVEDVSQSYICKNHLSDCWLSSNLTLQMF